MWRNLSYRQFSVRLGYGWQNLSHRPFSARLEDILFCYMVLALILGKNKLQPFCNLHTERYITTYIGLVHFCFQWRGTQRIRLFCLLYFSTDCNLCLLRPLLRLVTVLSVSCVSFDLSYLWLLYSLQLTCASI